MGLDAGCHQFLLLLQAFFPASSLLFLSPPTLPTWFPGFWSYSDWQIPRRRWCHQKQPACDFLTEVPRHSAIRIPSSNFLSPLSVAWVASRTRPRGLMQVRAAGPPGTKPATWRPRGSIQREWKGPKGAHSGSYHGQASWGLEVVSGLEELFLEDTIDQSWSSSTCPTWAPAAAVGCWWGRRWWEGSIDGRVSPSHPRAYSQTRDLILKWPGPERALNSALVEEITPALCPAGARVELIKDTEDPDEEGEGEEGPSIIPSSPEGDTPKESPRNPLGAPLW